MERAPVEPQQVRGFRLVAAEELGLEQAGRDRRAFFRDHGAVSARALLMNRLGGQLLTGPRLSM